MNLSRGLVLLAALGACRDEPRPVDPSPDVGASVAEAAESIDPDVGVTVSDPFAGLEPGLELLDAGTEPRSTLSLSAAVGDHRTFTILTIIDPSDTEDRVALANVDGRTPADVDPGQPMAPIPLRMVLLLRAEEVSDDGRTTWSVRPQTVELLRGSDATVTLSKGLRKALRTLARLRGSVQVADDAVAISGFAAGKTPHPVVQHALEVIRGALAQLAGPVPDVPLGADARWRIIRSKTAAKSAFGRVVTFTLAGVGDAGLELRLVPDLQPNVADGRTPTVAMHLATSATSGSASDRFDLEGHAVQGGLLHGKTIPGTRVWVGSRRMPVSDDGHFLVGFGRDASPSQHVVLVFPDGTRSEHIVDVEQRSYAPEWIDGLPDELVNPGKDAQRKIRAFNKAIEKIRARPSMVPRYLAGFIWPVKGRITSTYGRHRTLNGASKGYHWGVDLAAPVGRKVRAPASGTIVFVEPNHPLSGQIIVLDHGLGLSSSFLHLGQIAVAAGQEVERGQVLGRVGNSGRATGPHLDWRMNLLGVRLDPELLVEGEP